MPHRSTRVGLALACMALATHAFAQTDESLLLAPWDNDKQVVDNSSDVLLFSNSHLNATHSDTSFFQIESTGRYRLGTSRELNPTLGYDWTHIGTNTHSDPIPSSLDDLSFAIASPLAKVGDWFVGATAGIGYAGDAAFGDGRGWYGIGSIMAGTQFSKDSALVLFIDYDGNRTYLPDVPLPGFAFTGKWGEDLHYAIGFPINAVEWTPIDRLKFSLSTYLGISIDATAEYKLTHDWRVFAKYADREDAFNDSDLPSDRRLFYNETRAEGGIGYALGDNVEFQAGIGYAFFRTFSTGFDERSLSRVTRVSDEPYARLGVTVRF